MEGLRDKSKMWTLFEHKCKQTNWKEYIFNKRQLEKTEHGMGTGY